VVGVRDNLEGRSLGELELGASSTAQALHEGILNVLEAGLTFDVCVRSAQLSELIGLLGSIVEVRGSAAGLVLDHLGKPLPDGSVTERESWAQAMKQLADLPGLHVKFSGLPGQVLGDDGPARAHELVRDHLEVLDVFGAHRTMLGTDHPVSTLAHGLEASGWVAASIPEFRDRLTADELAPAAGGAAIEFDGVRRHPWPSRTLSSADCTTSEASASAVRRSATSTEAFMTRPPSRPSPRPGIRASATSTLLPTTA